MIRSLFFVFVVLFGANQLALAQDAQSLTNQANNAFNEGKYDEAIRLFTEAIRFDPKDAHLYNKRGCAHQKKGDNDKAISDYTEAIRLNPKDPANYINRGNAYNANREFDLAIIDCTDAIELIPKFEAIQFNPALAIAYSYRGYAYQNKGDNDSAISDHSKAIQFNPEFVFAYQNRGAAFASKGEFNKGINDYTEAIRLDPNDASIFNNRAFIYGKLGKYEDAISDASEAIRIDPRYATAYRHRGFAYLKQDKFQQAIEDCTEAIKLNPTYGRAYTTRGQAYAAQGNRDLALADYRKALEIDKKKAEEEGVPALLAAIERPVDAQPPTLEITRPVVVRGQGVRPSEKPAVNTSRVTVAGIVRDDAGVSEVRVNGEAARLDAQGNFSAEVLLKIGNNPITVVALDVKGNQTSRDFTVVRSEGESVTEPTLQIGKYYALLIGVQNYRDSQVKSLDYPLQDVAKVKDILAQNYTFDEANIIVLRDPDRTQIINALDLLAQKLSEDDNLLIFYAGHGNWDERLKQGFWLPSNAQPEKRAEWVSNSSLRDYIGGIRTLHTLLISDSCFSGSIFRSREAFSSSPTAIRELYKLPSRKAMTSGALKEVPDRSVFVEYLIKRLKQNEEPYLSAETLFSSMRQAVINNSPNSQVPQFGEIREAGDEGGDFIFVKRVK